ncbi:MAG: glycosyltransferase family 2 protein [Thermoplasmata archaeon]|nr:glycosyltransferase family 2 protein [Thermoplasmata archaeon]
MIEPVARAGEASPRLTVVLFVHGARQWLGEALDSIAAQRLESSSFETLVVGTLPEPERSRLLAGRSARFLEVEGPELGRKAAAALAASRGEVLVFLEDDDRFAPTKLAEVLDRFDADPTLTYYHNSFLAIDESGRALDPPYFRRDAVVRTARLGRVLVSPRTPRGTLSYLRGLFPGYNNSSISVRRRMLEPWAAALAQSDLLVDQFLFVAALSSPGSLLLDDRPLTELRLHRESASSASRPSADEFERLRRLSERNLAVRTVLLDVARTSEDPSVVRYVQGSIALEEVIAKLRGAHQGRSQSALLLLDLLRLSATLEVRSYPSVVPLAGLSVASPRLAGHIYRAAKQFVA